MPGPLAGLRIGWIGLGRMGRPMAARLADAGAGLATWTRSGGGSHPTPAALAAESEIIITCVADSPALTAVIQGPDGVLHGLRAGARLVDMGTSDVTLTRALGAAVAELGGAWIDAPVSGGVGGAEAGSLTIMIGGAADDVAALDPVFAVLGQRRTHVGPLGAGQIAKTANQMIVGLSIAAVAEALALAARAGADPALVRAAIRGGFAESRVLELHGARMVTQDFAPRATMTIQAKDLRQAADLAGRVGLAVPLTDLALQLYDDLIRAGGGDLDHAGFITRYGP